MREKLIGKYGDQKGDYVKKKIARSLICLESRILKEGRVGVTNLRDKRQENR